MSFTVYRCFDASGTLLYVGATENISARMNQHRVNSAWFNEAVRVETSTFSDKASMLEAERAAIRDECPAFNIMGNPAPDLERVAAARAAMPAKKPSMPVLPDLQDPRAATLVQLVDRIADLRRQHREKERQVRKVLAEAKSHGFSKAHVLSLVSA